METISPMLSSVAIAAPPVTAVSHSLSVVLPAYNEEASIQQTIYTITNVLSGWINDFEIIVINDGSKDHTGEIVKWLCQHNSYLRLVNHKINQGYGAALITGFESASKELVFFMDADGQFDIRDLARFLPLIEDYDAVLGYRNPRCDSWMRNLNAWGWKQLIRLALGIHVRDIDCAFKLFRAEFFETRRLETRGAMINAEILYKFSRAGYTYTEVDVHHLPRQGGKATGAKPAVILRALREMLFYTSKWYREERAASTPMLR